jgi:hypothetical protein
MRTQSPDTRPEVERVLIELIRKASVAKRFKLVRGNTEVTVKMNRSSFRKSCPDATKAEVGADFVKGHFNQTLAHGVQVALEQREGPYIPDLFVTLTSAIEWFERLAVPYYIAGTLAASIYGMQRVAFQIDLVADLHLEHLDSLVESLQATYYLDVEAIKEAILQRTHFQIIHLDALLLLTISLPAARAFDQEIANRVQRELLVEDDPRAICFISPEDIVLTQLEEYRDGGSKDDGQYNEILGVLKVQGSNLDLLYLQHWAHILNLAHLLQEACIDAGLLE